ncbi:MAG TPA: molybdenum cofactor guanylyltransferase, partial [Mycobacteriales bacterium]|nr:molybdenum cofactor guanylyltransferase [Mycobacteriales bacterium]
MTRPFDMVTGPLPGPYDAVVLTGGRASRMGGIAKPELRLRGRTLAERVLAAVRDADRSIVVGPAVRDVPVDLVTREEPPGGGPVAALAAGLVGVRAPAVATLAADLPFLDAATVRRLRAALAGERGAAVALPVDAEGRDQLLCAVWKTAALRAALARVGGPAGVPLRAVLAAATGPVVRLSGDGAAGLP